MTTKIDQLKNELEKLSGHDLEAEHRLREASSEVAEIQSQLKDAEQESRRAADVAEVNELQAVLDQRSDDFRALVANVYRAWLNIEAALKESEEIRAFLERARELGQTVSDAPPSLCSVYVPPTLTNEFQTRYGLDGLEWFKARVREGRYFKADHHWLYAQGLAAGY